MSIQPEPEEIDPAKFSARCPCGWEGPDRFDRVVAVSDADGHTDETGHEFDHQQPRGKVEQVS